MRAHDAGERVSGEIVRRIKKQIFGGRFEAGQQPPTERDMARHFNISRSSVREAYRALERLGLLDIRRGAEGGAFVLHVSDEIVRQSMSLVFDLNRTSHTELTDARLLIEPLIARLGALRARPEDIARLEDELVNEEERSFIGWSANAHAISR